MDYVWDLWEAVLKSGARLEVIPVTRPLDADLSGVETVARGIFE
jgi:hypothetical protein